MPNWCETQFPYQMSLASCSNNTTVAAAGGVGTANPSLPLVGFMLLIKKEKKKKKKKKKKK
jgi:hypothetical protein